MQTNSLIYNTFKFNTSFPNVFEVSIRCLMLMLGFY